MDSLAKKVTSATLVIILLGFMLMVARTNRFSAEDEIAAFPQETEQQPEATIKFNDHGGKSKQALGYELNETADGQEAGNRKPMTYGEFQQHIKNSQGALVLVSSANDNTYWPTTKGHYVTIWLYDEETDTVFLSDPGAYQRNRQRIPLTYVYNALKTASNYQYLLINRYDEGKNTWKADGITETWYRP